MTVSLACEEPHACSSSLLSQGHLSLRHQFQFGLCLYNPPLDITQDCTFFTGYVTKNQGENLTMVCTTTEETDHVGLFLYARLPEKHQVFYYDKSSKAVTPNKEYIGKVNTSGEIQNLTITITGLQERDSGFYSCVYNSLSGARVTEKETNGVLLFVKEVQPPRSTEAPGKEPSAMPEMLVLVSALTACAVVILCFLVAGVWVIPKSDDMNLKRHAVRFNWWVGYETIKRSPIECLDMRNTLGSDHHNAELPSQVTSAMYPFTINTTLRDHIPTTLPFPMALVRAWTA
ncbi:hypothetical protein NFI96_005170 [Prochilodus magdalenae]|nr:hypothetical protein NFI96_005170 [Prochilodus magdalenae]